LRISKITATEKLTFATHSHEAVQMHVAYPASSIQRVFEITREGVTKLVKIIEADSLMSADRIIKCFAKSVHTPIPARNS
jgi:hypothetical protein